MFYRTCTFLGWYNQCKEDALRSSVMRAQSQSHYQRCTLHMAKPSVVVLLAPKLKRLDDYDYYLLTRATLRCLDRFRSILFQIQKHPYVLLLLYTTRMLFCLGALRHIYHGGLVRNNIVRLTQLIVRRGISSVLSIWCKSHNKISMFSQKFN